MWYMASYQNPVQLGHGLFSIWGIRAMLSRWEMTSLLRVLEQTPKSCTEPSTAWVSPPTRFSCIPHSLSGRGRSTPSLLNFPPCFKFTVAINFDSNCFYDTFLQRQMLNWIFTLFFQYVYRFRGDSLEHKHFFATGWISRITSSSPAEANQRSQYHIPPTSHPSGFGPENLA